MTSHVALLAVHDEVGPVRSQALSMAWFDLGLTIVWERKEPYKVKKGKPYKAEEGTKENGKLEPTTEFRTGVTGKTMTL